MKNTTKRLVWFCAINGVLWVWCSYLLAYLGRTEIAESLSKTAVTEIIAVILCYCLKSLFEKRSDFGSVGQNFDAKIKKSADFIIQDDDLDNSIIKNADFKNEEENLP